MFKRALDIIVLPFRLIYLLLSFPVRITYIILKDKKENPAKIRKGFSPSAESNTIVFNKTDILKAGQLLYPEYQREFEKFFNSFITDRKNFLAENKDLLKGYDNFDLKNLKAVEVIYIFGDSKELLWMTDWRGEENEREIESYLESRIQMKINWGEVNKLRKGASEEDLRDSNFIIDLLKSVDKDLEPLNKKLIFFSLDWDAYVYTVIDKMSYKALTSKYRTLFHGTETLAN